MNLDFKFYWSLFVRRLPVMTAVFLLCAGIGIALAFKLPTTYSSRARMLVEAPQISGLEGVQKAGAEQLEIIQQSLMTRANLIDIANDRNVFGKNHGLSPDQVVAKMREMTVIRRSSGRNRATLMSITFNASKPRIAANVANDYVTLILAENESLQGGKVERTLEFFAQEVQRLSTNLNLQSEKIVAFKQANIDALPDTLNYRLNRESMLQERVTQLTRQLANAGERRQRLVDVFEATGQVTNPRRRELTTSEKRLANLEAKLEGMRLTLSDSNPRVKVVISQIQQTRAQVAAEGGDLSDTETSQETIFNLQLAEIDGQIENLESNRTNDMKELEVLRASIQETATNGITLADLERDYANIQNQYNNAVSRRDQAQISQSATTSNLTGQIRLIEPPTVPNAPASPNRPAVAAAGVGVGIGAMAALFALLEVLNRAIRRPVELTKSLGVTPLATIPYMQTRRSFWLRRSLKFLVLIVVIMIVPLILWAVDTYYRPLDLIFDRLMQQIGL